MLWAGFLVVGAFVIAYFAWDFHKKAAAREAASRQRFEEMLRAQASASATAPASGAPATPSVATRAAPAAVPPPVAPAAEAPAARERFLGPRETLLYYLLRTGLPDHEVFANVSLLSLVAPPAGAAEREQRQRRLGPYRLDFVVCDKSLHIVAAVELDADDAAAHQFKAELLRQAGIRLIRVNPASMPKREQVRLLIGGAPT